MQRQFASVCMYAPCWWLFMGLLASRHRLSVWFFLFSSLPQTAVTPLLILLTVQMHLECDPSWTFPNPRPVAFLHPASHVVGLFCVSPSTSVDAPLVIDYGFWMNCVLGDKIPFLPSERVWCSAFGSCLHCSLTQLTHQKEFSCYVNTFYRLQLQMGFKKYDWE